MAGFKAQWESQPARFFSKVPAQKLFGLVKISRTRHVNIPSVVLGPGQARGQHSERQNNPGNDDGGFSWHGYSSFFGNGAIVTVRSASLRYLIAA